MLPQIDTEFICIADRRSPLLTGVVLSYLHRPNVYTPIFVFPYVETGEYDVKLEDENYVMVHRAKEFRTRISNALMSVGGCKNLILVGLNDNQKSFLTYLKEYKVIEVGSTDDVDCLLSHLSKKTEYLPCRESQIFLGSYLAAKQQKLLQIDNDALLLECNPQYTKGLIVIENRNNVHSIVAIAYALSINADISIIETPDVDKEEVRNELVRWQETGDSTNINNLGAMIFPSLEMIDFNRYSFATFFTSGIPYPLVLKNVIPFTCVHNDLHPDFFVFNNLYCEAADLLPSAIVFSPLEFGTDEETDFIIKKLHDKNYYVTELIDGEASTTNMENYVREFPFGILHLCSHGGEVDGYEREFTFTDRDANVHKIEFDEVVSFSADGTPGMIKTTSKWYYRKFDGLTWKSKELRDKNYPHYVFSDMAAALHADTSRRRKRKNVIPGSAAIKCKAFSYLADFNMIAGWHYNPFIFNNTCWSNSEISHSFLGVGARGYIGTLWGVNNNVAKSVAEAFYEHAFEMTALESLKVALENTKGTPDENIYLFWGLHVTRLRPGSSSAESRAIIAGKINNSIRSLKKHAAELTDHGAKDRMNFIIRWNCRQLIDKFLPEAIRMGVIGLRKM